MQMNNQFQNHYLVRLMYLLLEVDKLRLQRTEMKLLLLQKLHLASLMQKVQM